MKTWTQLFRDPQEDQVNQKRLQEIGVALSELETLKKEAKVYQGSEKTVFFLAAQPSVKAGLKKEQNR